MENGDKIEIDIPSRTIHLCVSQEELQRRRSTMNSLPTNQAWQPSGVRTRVVTKALRSYAAFASSADRGGVREVP